MIPTVAADAVLQDREFPGETGFLRPEVDPSRCRGGGACVAACPAGVFDLGRVSESVLDALPRLVRLRLRMQGMTVARTPRADACRACERCLAACRRGAIRLVPVDAVLDGVLDRLPWRVGAAPLPPGEL